MNRKVIRLANSTSVISLPSKWVRKYGIAKGDEVSVEERGDSLVVNLSSSSSEGKKEIEVSIPDNGERTVIWTIVGLYRAGFDRIVVSHNGDVAVEKIHKYVSGQLDGFQITEEAEQRFVIENVAKQREEDFNSLFRKVIRLVSQIAERSLEQIRTKKSDHLDDLLSLEESMNRLNNICQRLLTKGAPVPDNLRTQFTIVSWHCQKLSNYYKSIYLYLSKHQNIKLSQAALNIYEDTNRIVHEYLSLYGKLDILKMRELYEESRTMAEETMLTQFSKEEYPVLLNLIFILNRIADICTPLVSIDQTMHQKIVS